MGSSGFFKGVNFENFLKRKTKIPINSIVEEELRETLDKIWENRVYLTEPFILKLLKKISEKKYLGGLK